MNKDINSLYEQYKSLGNPETFDEFVQLKDQVGEDMFFEFMNNYVSDSLKKKENSQETPSNSSGLGENQPTPISAQGNPQITSVPISQDLDLNQAQIEAMQGVQNPASLNLELPQQSVNQNGLLESNGEVNTSSSVLEDSFNKFIQEGGQLPLNPTSTRLNVLPRAYEEQFNNVTQTTPQVSVSENINATNNDFVDFGNGITLPKELLPEEKTKEEFNKEIAESAKDVILKQSGKLETFDIENPKWISRNIGDLQGEDYVRYILQKEKEGKVKVARNEKGELIDKDLKPILDNSNVLWQPIGSYINDYNNNVNEFNKEIELNNQKISKNNSLIESQNIRDLFLGKKEEPKSPLTTLYNKIYSDTGILLTEEQKAQFKTIDDVYNFYASEKAKKAVQDNPKLNYNEEYNKLINDLNPKIDAQQNLQLGKNFVNNFLLGFRIEEEKAFNEARGYGAKIDPSYQKGYISKEDLQEINFIKNLSNNQYGLGLIGEWWNAVGKKEIGTTNYKINATLSTPEGRADVINSIANFINARGSIQKELAYENIQRGKFNILKNAKEGNVLALQDSINFIQSESNKINQIDTQQKEIYDFIDSWKKTQVRNNKKEQEFAKTYSGYQNGEILPSIKIIAGNTVNGISDAVKSTIAGVAQLPNLVIGSDEYNDVISEIKKPSEFFGVKTSGMFSKYYDYKSGGKNIRFQNGNYYELVNGDYRPINLTYAQISNLGKAKEGEEFSIAGMIGDTTRMATEVALAEFTGSVALKGLSKFSQLRNIERASSVFGEESALTNSLQRLERFSKNPTNNGYFGWFTQTIADNYQEGKAKGMTNTQASVYASVQSLLTSFLSRINPDVKFFKTYKEIDEKLIGSLLKNDKQGFLNNLKSLSNHIGGEISSETGQELTERFAQEIVRQFYNTSLTDKKFDTMTADDVLKTVITTAITTGALTSSNLALRGSGDNIINYDNAYYNSTQLSEGQKLVMLANLNTSEIFKNFNNQFISDKNKLNEIEQTVKSIKTYLDKIPNKDKYTLNTQTKAVSLLYEIDQKRKQLNNVDESFKDDINAEINRLSNELKQLLNDDLKLQNEQPQQTPQPSQKQETTQGQTTETNLQPEQGTTTTEQGVSADVDRKEVYAQDIANGNIVSFVYENESEVPNVFKDRITSDSTINGKRTIRVSMSKSEAEDLLKNNNQTLPTNETEQTTKPQQSNVGNTQTPEIIGNQTDETTISEEEQEKINLERLNAYIEAKKQREQEQQVQVSPSEEMGNVQQNEAFSVNEQPQTIEQPSETQTTPLVSESKSNNGKYTIRVQQNSNTGIADAKIFDNNGNEVKLSNKQKEKYVAEHFAKQSYPETVVENMDKLRADEYSSAIVEATNNPLELAQILATESKFLPPESLNPKENAIANVIGNKVSRSSFIQFDDANNISFSIARGYGLSNKGKTIDVIAQEAEVFLYGDWDSQNPRITTEDVIDFMKTYNNGAQTFFTQPNQVYRDAEAKFEKLTGIKATKNALDVLLGKKTATKIDFAKLQKEADLLSAEQAYNLEKEYNEWFNSLSLEDKNLELQKTYPYEQRTEENIREPKNESISNNQTESSENVANQERDGATAEEINQVSPSPQYEGVAKTKDKAGKVYNANSSEAKNLKDAEGDATQLQKGNQRLTPITKQAFEALVTRLQKAFPRFAKVIYDFEAFKKQAEKLGATFNDIQRMVMAFHGSPHSFDKFTTEKIGTGEGAQAFGWGLYFTDLESIARNYAKNLGKLQLKQQYKGEDVIPQSPTDAAAGILNNVRYNTIKLAIEQAKNLRDIAITDFPDRVDFWNDVIDVLSKSKKSDFKKVESKVLYSVSLHKGKTPEQYTWLEWDKPVSDSDIKKIKEQALKEDITDRWGRSVNDNGYYPNSIPFSQNIKGSELYSQLQNEFNLTPKEVSLFLLRSGIDGIKYPAESISRGATSDTARGFNYVVFDENAVTIEDKIQFMQTPNGTIYGAKLPDGTIYLNPEFLNANTPIHEFSHLFEQLLPSRFKKGVELLKQTNLGKKLFEQLKQEGNYANLTDEQLWSEALNTHIGNFGENEVNNPKGKLKQLQDWIKDFFAKVGEVLGIKKLSPDTQLRMFTESVVKDLLGGKPIVAEREAIKAEAQVNGTFMKAPNRNVQVYITPATVRNFNEETLKLKELTNEYNKVAKEISQGNLENQEEFTNLQHKILDAYQEYIKEKVSKIRGVNVNFNQPYLGSWQGKYEPSLNMTLSISPNADTGAISGLLFDIAENTSQDAFILEERSEIEDRTPLTEFDEEGMMHYPQIRVIFDNQLSVAEKSIIAQRLKNKGVEEFSIDGDYFIVSIIDFNSETYEQKEEFYTEKVTSITTPFRGEGEKVGTNRVRDVQKHIRKSKYVGARNEGDEQSQTREYDRSDLFETQSSNTRYQVTGEQETTDNIGTYSANNNDIRFSINSKTPLSVKEQTEVINELVSNGEESAFAKLQETNWYKGLTDNQKQNITPTNIAETVVNAIKATKRSLEQKVERRDAKIEKLQDKNKSELEKQKKYYVDKINEIKQKYKEALIELNLKNNTAVEKVKERLDLRKSAINQIKQLLSNKEVGKNVTPSEVMSLVRVSELFFNARDLDKAFDKFIIRFEKVFDKAQYRNKSAEEKFNDELSKVNPLKADEKASYRREKKSLKERMLIFKNKWFANQGGIIKPFLEHRDRATGLANWEKRVAKNTVEKLTDEANKIGFNTESNWEIFNNALQGDKTAMDRLPETIKPYVMMMRSQIDGLSLELIKNDLVTKEQALIIEENLGKYITRGYSIFEGDTTIEKVGKKFFRMIFKKENSIASRFDSEKWADAVTVFQQNVLNEIALDNSGKYDKYDTDEKKQSYARQEGERRLLEYISELESEYKKAGSGVGADTSVLERRKEIAEPIRRLLGEYTDPRISFLLTVSRVSDLAYQRKFLSQVKEIGLGTFLFEEGDPNIPIEGYVKIASDTNSAYSPLNGLYTTKEFKDVFLGEPQKEKYEIEKLWLKLTGLVKVGKTVFSPITQAINFNANFGFLINNGLILDVKQISPAFKAFADAISNGRLDNYIVRELIEENILGQSLIFNEVEKDFGINMEKELIKSIRQTTAAKTAKEIVDIPFRLYKASDDFFKAFAYFSEADRYAKAYFGKKYEELTGDDRMKIRKIASEVVKNTMPNYDRVYKAANFPKEFTRNAVGNYLSFQAESIRTKINSIQYAIADLKNEKTRAVGAKRLAGIMTYNAIYGTVTTLVGKATGMGMAGLLGFFDDEDEDEKRANFNLTVPEWARSVEKYYRREKDGTITWFAYGNANPYGIWYKTANAYFNGSSNTKGGLISVFDELLTPFIGTEMSLKWISNTFIAEKNDYGVPLITPKDKLNYSIEKLSPSIVKLIKDNTDNRKENDFELVNILGIKKYNFNPTDQLRYKYNDYAELMSDLGRKKYTLEKQVESGKKKPEEVMEEWQDYDEKQKEYADEFRELAIAYISLGADPTLIQEKATEKFKYEINSISDWWDYITRPE